MNERFGALVKEAESLLDTRPSASRKAELAANPAAAAADAAERLNGARRVAIRLVELARVYTRARHRCELIALGIEAGGEPSVADYGKRFRWQCVAGRRSSARLLLGGSRWQCASAEWPPSARWAGCRIGRFRCASALVCYWSARRRGRRRPLGGRRPHTPPCGGRVVWRARVQTGGVVTHTLSRLACTRRGGFSLQVPRGGPRCCARVEDHRARLREGRDRGGGPRGRARAARVPRGTQALARRTGWWGAIG